MKKYFPIKLFYQITTVFFLSIFFLNNLNVNAAAVTQCIANNGFQNDGKCLFGDDWQESEPTVSVVKKPVGNLTVSTNVYEYTGVIVDGNSCLNGGKANVNWGSHNYFCIGTGYQDTITETKVTHNFPSLPYPPNYNLQNKRVTSQWVECLQTNQQGKRNISKTSDLIQLYKMDKLYEKPPVSAIEPGLKFTWVEIGYSVKGQLGSGELSHCKACNSDDITKCPNYKKATDTKCAIDVNRKVCTFGQVVGATDNQNCAKTKLPAKNWSEKDSKVYICSSDNVTLKCSNVGNPGIGNVDYDLIFQPEYDRPLNPNNPDPNRSRLYRTTKPEYKCEKLTTSKEQCVLNDADTFSNTCTFGSWISTSTDEKKNCAVLEEKKEYRNESDGSYRFLICSPENRKYTCNYKIKDVSYSKLYSTRLDTGTGARDYEGAQLTPEAKSSTGYDCKPYEVPPLTTCNIDPKVTKEGKCIVPVACFNNADPVITKIGDEEVALYCMSVSARDKYQGFIYYCPTSSGTKKYTDISINQNEYIYLSSGGSECKRYTDTFVNIKLRQSDKFSPLGLIKAVSNLLYYFAIFYFIVLILLNGFAYVRSGEDPSKLKQINESLFNTIAGFIFVLASGGVILYLINSIK